MQPLLIRGICTLFASVWVSRSILTSVFRMPLTHFPALGVKTLSLYLQADAVEAHPPPPISFWAVKRDQEVIISQYLFSLSSLVIACRRVINI